MRNQNVSPADEWTRERLNALAKTHFRSQHEVLESVIRRLVERHEEVWRAQPPGSYRPTAPMYALALQWELDKLGPRCSVCEGEVALPTGPSSRAPQGSCLSLALRLPLVAGGLNVPQNLALCHAGCMPGLGG